MAKSCKRYVSNNQQLVFLLEEMNCPFSASSQKPKQSPIFPISKNVSNPTFFFFNFSYIILSEK